MNKRAETEILVVGSNLAGKGIQGNSYGIPTKDKFLRTLPLDQIQIYVTEFVIFACMNSDLMFNVTAIGCGLAGYRPKDIAPLFWPVVPDNVRLPEQFIDVLADLTVRVGGSRKL